jgi:hypothetical protein
MVKVNLQEERERTENGERMSDGNSLPHRTREWDRTCFQHNRSLLRFLC